MNKIKTQIGTALLVAMMAGSVHSQEMEVITDPKKICKKMSSIVKVYNKREKYDEDKLMSELQNVFTDPVTTISDIYGDQKKKINARILVDGSIKYQQSEGSIHKIAAKILGAESCNGWTFWHYKSGNSLKPIDELRQRLRSSN